MLCYLSKDWPSFNRSFFSNNEKFSLDRKISKQEPLLVLNIKNMGDDDLLEYKIMDKNAKILYLYITKSEKENCVKTYD